MSQAALFPPASEMQSKVTLGDALIVGGKLSEEALRRALNAQQASGEKLETVLANLGLVSETDIAETLAVVFDLPYISADKFPLEAILTDKLNRKFLKHSILLPLKETEEELIIAMADPGDDYAVQAIKFVVNKPISKCVASSSNILNAVERLYGNGASVIEQLAGEAQLTGHAEDNDDVERLKDLASEAPVIRLVNVLINEAVEARASDIHIEPMESRLRVRFRVDGILYDVESPAKDLSAAIISRIKIMAQLDIAERRLAQDGRIRLAVRGKEIDFRVSTTPAMHGESIVLRILDRSGLALDFEGMGFEGKSLDTYRKLLALPHGIILITGPTGSGKTTTLYASLRTLNSPEKKILTIEDPVEYILEGVNQVQVRPRIGLTFPNALRSFLRQDPDIMMVGEIRDAETAQIAVQAALTGHTILSTLHTNDAASAITRLLNMGIEDFLLTSTINGLVGQRLVRKLCQHCREPYSATEELIEKFDLRRVSLSSQITLYRHKGCEHCSHMGYYQRTCIHEVMVISDQIQKLILQHAGAQKIRDAAISEGMVPIILDGIKKALAGITTIEEVFRVTKDV